MSLIHSCWALDAEGLRPASKLVLILAANACDQDGRLFEPFEPLAARANLIREGLDLAVAELTEAGLAAYSIAEDPETGSQRPCVQLMMAEA